MQKKQLNLTGSIDSKSIDTEKRIVTFVVSDGEIDRHGESLNPEGWHFENYLANPVIMFGHDYKTLPIGKALKVWVENGKQVLATIEMATHEFAQNVFDLIQGGFLNTTSVGLIPLKLDETGKYTWGEQELLEISVVPVPANPRALRKEFVSAYEAIEKETGMILLEQSKDDDGSVSEAGEQSEQPNPDDAESQSESASDEPVVKTIGEISVEDFKSAISEAVTAGLQKHFETSVSTSEESKDNPTDSKVTLEAVRNELKTIDKGIGHTLRMMKNALAQ